MSDLEIYVLKVKTLTVFTLQSYLISKLNFV